MQPVSVLFLLLGYPPFALTLVRWPDVVARQARLAALGHQVGGWAVVAGWLLAGRLLMAAGHAAWLVLARLWFARGGPGRVNR